VKLITMRSQDHRDGKRRWVRPLPHFSADSAQQTNLRGLIQFKVIFDFIDCPQQEIRRHNRLSNSRRELHYREVEGAAGLFKDLRRILLEAHDRFLHPESRGAGCGETMMQWNRPN
jgi:hypothetical protein